MRPVDAKVLGFWPTSYLLIGKDTTAHNHSRACEYLSIVYVLTLRGAS